MSSINLAEIVSNQIMIGIEVEKTRVDNQNELSSKPFPDNMGELNQYVNKEFSTAQLELVLPPNHDVDNIIGRLEKIIKQMDNKISPDEKLWNYSCPPKLPEDIPMTNTTEDMNEYRLKCAKKYDVRTLMNTGVHVNLSFSKEATDYLVEQSQFENSNELYLQIAQYFMLNRWIFTYLFGATPIAEQNYFDIPMVKPVRSIRNSSFGFTNDVRGDYRTIEDYVTTIENAIETGKLYKSREYYEAVRLKCNGSSNLKDLIKNGITHLELRTFDLNPLTLSGIASDQLRLIQIMALYFAKMPRTSKTRLLSDLAAAHEINEQVALERVGQKCAYAQQGLNVLDNARQFVNLAHLPQEFNLVLDHFMDHFKHPKKTLAYQVYNTITAVQRCPEKLNFQIQ